jgi:ketohexokinase
MIEHVLAQRALHKRSTPIVSVEAEKVWGLGFIVYWFVYLLLVRPYPLVEQLIPGCDYIFISKDFARKHNCTNMKDAVTFVKNTFASPHATVICGWGDKGACAIDDKQTVYEVNAHVPENGVVDTLGTLYAELWYQHININTLGAGDTFIASVIGALSSGRTLSASLTYGCRIAGHKCGQRGLGSLEGLWFGIL